MSSQLEVPIPDRPKPRWVLSRRQAVVILLVGYLVVIGMAWGIFFAVERIQGREDYPWMTGVFALVMVPIFLWSVVMILRRAPRPKWPGEEPWVLQMYDLVASKRLEEAIDLLYDNVDDMLLEGKMQECDDILQQIDIRRLDSYLMIGLLSITLSASEHLPHRKVLVEEIENYLRATEPERADALMKGLR